MYNSTEALARNNALDSDSQCRDYARLDRARYFDCGRSGYFADDAAARMAPRSAVTTPPSAGTAHAMEMLPNGDHLRPAELPKAELDPFVSANYGRPLPNRLALALASVTLVPLRVLCLLVLILAMWLVAAIALVGAPPTGLGAMCPLGPLRRRLLAPMAPIFRCALFVVGYHTIETHGRPFPKARIIVCNHTTFLDPMLLCASLGTVSFVGAQRYASIPIISTVGRAMHHIILDRRNHDSRGAVLREINARARSTQPWPHVAIFPEGTTTSGKALIRFKKGAFTPGVVVQPVVVRYPFAAVDPAWVAAGPQLATLLWLLLCQLENHAIVTWLQPYEPSAAEAADPDLFAENVRGVMAAALKIPVTDHTAHADSSLDEAASKEQVPAGGPDQYAEFENCEFEKCVEAHPEVHGMKRAS
ncbi:hypothetical protein T492DRAFT_1151703 [Pavlovales sp. CCMP2436]|nr:hypothetical protein T492DRAFT_1151703 [Pavlovales sp. CCMP2436]